MIHNKMYYTLVLYIFTKQHITNVSIGKRKLYSICTLIQHRILLKRILIIFFKYNEKLAK